MHRREDIPRGLHTRCISLTPGGVSQLKDSTWNRTQRRGLSPSSCRQHVQRLFPAVLPCPQGLQPHTVACRYPGREPSCSALTARQPLYRAGPQDESRTAHLRKGGSHGARRGLAMFLGMSLQVSLVQFATWGASRPCKLRPPAGEPIGPQHCTPHEAGTAPARVSGTHRALNKHSAKKPPLAATEGHGRQLDSVYVPVGTSARDGACVCSDRW